MYERCLTEPSILANGLALADIIAVGTPLRRRIAKYNPQCVLMQQIAVVIAPRIPAIIKIVL